MRSVNVVRARLVDQGERARPPWEGRRHDPMPPSSPGEIPAGPSTLSEAAVPVEGEAESRPQPRKRHQNIERFSRPVLSIFFFRILSVFLSQAGSIFSNMPRIQLQIGPIFSNILYIPAENR